MIDRLPCMAARSVRILVHATSKPTPILSQSRSTALAHHSLKRFYSTPTQPASPPSPDLSTSATNIPSSTRPADLRSQLPSSFPPPNVPTPRRRFSTVVTAAIFLALGLTAGQFMTYTISPPSLPVPGSIEDEKFTAWVERQASTLPIVQSLTSDPLFESWDAFSSIVGEERKHNLNTGPLGGSRGLGAFQKIFRHRETGEVVCVVWIGGATSGWPGVTHGGLLATLLDENLGRVALGQGGLEGQTGVTATMSVRYLKPVQTSGFWVVRCTPFPEGGRGVLGIEGVRNPDQDRAMVERHKGGSGAVIGDGRRKMWVSGRVEALDGRVHTEAEALFVVPKNMKLATFQDRF